MEQVVTKAFVMNSFPWKDRHRLLHLLTPDLGLVTALAPASSSPRSKLAALTQLFSYSEFSLDIKPQRVTIKEGTLIESFADVSADLDRLAAAAHAAEVFSDVARNGEPQRVIFELWGYTLHAVSINEDPVLIALLGTLRLMEIIGYSPRLDACVICRRQLEGVPVFSYSAGGLLCEEDRACAQDALTVLSCGSLALLRHVMTVPFGRLFRFTASPAVRAQASCFASRWVEEKMEKRYKRLSILDQCRHFGWQAPNQTQEGGEGDVHLP